MRYLTELLDPSIFSLKSSSHKVTMSVFCLFSFLYFRCACPGVPPNAGSEHVRDVFSKRDKQRFLPLLSVCIEGS